MASSLAPCAKATQDRGLHSVALVFSLVDSCTGHSRHSDGKHSVGDYKIIVLGRQKQSINIDMVAENSL